MAAIPTSAKVVAPAKFEAELTEMDAGVLKDIPAKGAITIDGAPMTQAQIDTQLKGYIATIQAADAAKQQYTAAVTARKNITVAARAFYLQLKKAVIVYFGAQSPLLDDFGLAPAKPKTPKSAGEMALTTAKLNLTRAARGTTSKKQKATINPLVGTPNVAIGPTGKVLASLPTGSTTPAATSTAAGSSGSTPQTSAGSSTSTPSAPAPAGSGATGSTAS